MKNKAENLRDKSYYELAHQGSSNLSHPAMQLLLKLSIGKKKILDMGCGEGTRLNAVTLKAHGKTQAVGVDNNEVAIEMARKQYPKINFIKSDLAELPFKDDNFDLIFSAFVFEHLENPEGALIEARRVLKKNGVFLIVAPNFGAPNRRSPNSSESKIVKVINGFVNDLSIINASIVKRLYWNKVVPIHDKYLIDTDTTVEPYLNTLIKFSRYIGFKIEQVTSFWEIDKNSLSQLPFRILGELKIYPFIYWGPHLCLVLRK